MTDQTAKGASNGTDVIWHVWPPGTSDAYKAGFAAGVAAEREACAELAEAVTEEGRRRSDRGYYDMPPAPAVEIARRIRNRGEAQ